MTAGKKIRIEKKRREKNKEGKKGKEKEEMKERKRGRMIIFDTLL